MHVPGLGVQDSARFGVELGGAVITRVCFRSMEHFGSRVAHTNDQTDAIWERKWVGSRWNHRYC